MTNLPRQAPEAIAWCHQLADAYRAQTAKLEPAVLRRLHEIIHGDDPTEADAKQIVSLAQRALGELRTAQTRLARKVAH